MRLWFNLLCQDIEAQLQFYQDLLQLPEAPGTRSAIYRAVETEHFQLGFNAPEAYAANMVAYAQSMQDEASTAVAAAAEARAKAEAAKKTA